MLFQDISGFLIFFFFGYSWVSNGVVGSPAFAAYDQGLLNMSLDNICALENTSFSGTVTCRILLCFQGMMYFWGIFVVWFLGSMSTRTSRHVSKFANLISYTMLNFFLSEWNGKEGKGKGGYRELVEGMEKVAFPIFG